MKPDPIREAIDTVRNRGFRPPVTVETSDGRFSHGDYTAWLASLNRRGLTVDPNNPLRSVVALLPSEM
jgi:hypothetical protein